MPIRVQKHNTCEKDYIYNPVTLVAMQLGNVKYLVNIMNKLAIMCDEIIEPYDKETNTVPTNFNANRQPVKRRHFYALLVFLLFIITLLIAVSNEFYQIKH